MKNSVNFNPYLILSNCENFLIFQNLTVSFHNKINETQSVAEILSVLKWYSSTFIINNNKLIIEIMQSEGPILYSVHYCTFEKIANATHKVYKHKVLHIVNVGLLQFESKTIMSLKPQNYVHSIPALDSAKVSYHSYHFTFLLFVYKKLYFFVSVMKIIYNLKVTG